MSRVFGLTLVYAGCHMIMRFAERYYSAHKDQYSAAQQTELEQLFVVAQSVETAIAPFFIPLP